ncbi:MAG: NUDIX domain-containing protein [Gaiellales bacterium]|nr:MAG: NUDIX domain-containing protein [Gaiellales bacterium]
MGRPRSAGILAYRRAHGSGIEVMLVHPGGPFWAGKDEGAWSIPKGLYEEGEEPLQTARREFREETGFRPAAGEYVDLGELMQPSGKVIRAWAMEGDYDVSRLVSNTFPLEWPRGSGRMIDCPEVDRAEWFGLETARAKIARGQAGFLERLALELGDVREGGGS